MNRALAALVVLVGLLSGCSADESDDAAPRDDAASTTAEQSDDAAGSQEAAPSEDPGTVEGGTTPDARVDSGLPVPRTYDDAMAHFDALGSEPLNVRRFVLPSRNIYCAVKVKGIPPGCEINAGAPEDETCDGSPTSSVGRVEFVGGRAVAVCNTDTIQTPGAPVLDYGVAARFNNFKIMCLSESIGVTCVNLKKAEGFFLHRGEYVIFNAG